MASNLPKTMKAVQVIEFNKPWQLKDVPVPKDLGPFDLLVKVAVASYCHTDSMVQKGTFGTKLPITASHEGAGTVVAVGSDVVKSFEAGGYGASAAFKVGDRVMCGLPFHPCGKCDECNSKEERQRHYCLDLEGHKGVHLDGFFAEYAVVDSRSTTKLPDTISLLSAAPLACAGRTIWRGVEEAKLQKGQWLGIVGAGGGLGHLGIQFAKKQGLKVIAVDARDDGLALSKSSGADAVVDARKDKEDAVKEVMRVTNGTGCDATIVLADVDSAAGLSAAITRLHGTIVQIAQPDNVTIPFHEIVFRDIRVKGSILCSAGQSNEMVDFISKKGLEVKTNRFEGLDKYEKVVDLIHGGKIQGKAVIVIDQEQLDREKDLGARY